MAIRKFIKPGYTLQMFFGELHAAKIEYVLLRWPTFIAELEEVDILIADEQIADLNRFITRDIEPSGIAIDVYSVSGLKGSGYFRVPYYPRYLALRIIKSRETYNGICYIPSAKIHYLSFLFHIVFHKCEVAGFPTTAVNEVSAENKYFIEITRLAKICGCQVPPFSFDGMMEILRTDDWVPPIDWVRRVGYNRSQWLSGLFPAETTPSQACCFILRELAGSNREHQLVLREISRFGFNLVFYQILNGSRRLKARDYIRGGKWDDGPHTIDSGMPYSIYVIQDPSPQKSHGSSGDKSPFMTNDRFHNFKILLRKTWLTIFNDANVIHSSDDEIETHEYLKILIPEYYEQVYQKINHLKRLSNASNSPVETYSGLQKN